MTKPYHHYAFWVLSLLWALIGLRIVRQTSESLSTLFLIGAVFLFCSGLCLKTIERLWKEAAPYRLPPTQVLSKLAVNKLFFSAYLGSLFGLNAAIGLHASGIA